MKAVRDSHVRLFAPHSDFSGRRGQLFCPNPRTERLSYLGGSAACGVTPMLGPDATGLDGFTNTILKSIQPGRGRVATT